jgi:hypothetical protein
MKFWRRISELSDEQINRIVLAICTVLTLCLLVWLAAACVYVPR